MNETLRLLYDRFYKMCIRDRSHCWTEETEEIAMALPFGTFKESTWQYGKIIEGKVTPEFTSFLLGLPKPTDTDIYNKMTPVFTMALDNCFLSEHYGTELNGI